MSSVCTSRVRGPTAARTASSSSGSLRARIAISRGDLAPRLKLMQGAQALSPGTIFALFAGLYGARWVMFGHEARRIFGHNTVSMFIGTIPMGLATIINGCLAFGIARFGNGIVPVAHILWWIDVAMSLACGVLIPYLMFTRHEHSLDGMTAVWLLPVVAAEDQEAGHGARDGVDRDAGQQ